ncbi:DUF4124 domain-containing protein [Niveibacterium sp. 24ML]|uniref:DUF4124 domain-containing protein n=1 Tax=Niveibacterium sp. 24ML TaxID=2985512 RepID=UPI00226E6A6C|nr:DUF4124 domain-containing protein [Niveibacterium sp. 24ML]MCX9157999.1 DUF4124 domain-containing protein [Niveibacterium sp. 24ML]
MYRTLAALLLCAATSANAGVYKWTDENGKVHYSDIPPPKTDPSKVPLTPPSGFSGPEMPEPSSERTPRRAKSDETEKREQELKQACKQLRSEQQRLENAPSGNALKDGNQRAALAAAVERNQAMLKELGCDAVR